MKSRKIQMLALLLIVFSLNNMTAAGLGATGFNIEARSFFPRSSLQAPFAAKTIPQSSPDTRECSSTLPSEVTVPCGFCVFGPASRIPPSVGLPKEWQTLPAGSDALLERDSDFSSQIKNPVLKRFVPSSPAVLKGYSVNAVPRRLRKTRRPSRIPPSVGLPKEWQTLPAGSGALSKSVASLKKCIKEKKSSREVLENLKHCAAQGVLECPQLFISKEDLEKCGQDDDGWANSERFTSASFISCMPIRGFINELFRCIDVNGKLQICEAEHHPQLVRFCMPLKENFSIGACVKNEQGACLEFLPKEVLFVVRDTLEGSVVEIMPSPGPEERQTLSAGSDALSAQYSDFSSQIENPVLKRFVPSSPGAFKGPSVNAVPRKLRVMRRPSGVLPSVGLPKEWQTLPAGSDALSEQDSDFSSSSESPELEAVAFWENCIMEKKPGEVLENLKHCAAQIERGVLEHHQLCRSKEDFERMDGNIDFEVGWDIFDRFTSASFISCMPIRDFINELFEYIDVGKELQVCKAEHRSQLVRFYMPLKENSPIRACVKNEQGACEDCSPKEVLFVVRDTLEGSVVEIMPSMGDLD